MVSHPYQLFLVLLWGMGAVLVLARTWASLRRGTVSWHRSDLQYEEYLWYRSREPARYWFGIALGFVTGLALLAFAGYVALQLAR